MSVKIDQIYKITTSEWSVIAIVDRISEDNQYHFNDLKVFYSHSVSDSILCTWGVDINDFEKSYKSEFLGTKETHPEYCL